MSSKKRTIKVSISKTTQVVQYEPVTVLIEESVELEADEDPEETRSELYESVSDAVTRYMKKERKKWK